jgi:hypothetical protein
MRCGTFSGLRSRSVGQQCVGHVLVRHRPQEPLDRARADRRGARVGRRRERAAVHHRVADLDARAEAVDQNAAGLALERRAQRGEQRASSSAMCAAIVNWPSSDFSTRCSVSASGQRTISDAGPNTSLRNSGCATNASADVANSAARA